MLNASQACRRTEIVKRREKKKKNKPQLALALAKFSKLRLTSSYFAAPASLHLLNSPRKHTCVFEAV